MAFKILSINPGSTSSKIAVYEDETPLFVKSIAHAPEELDRFPGILEQYEFRRDCVLQSIQEHGIALTDLSAVVGRGGLLPPVKAGGYAVNQSMLDALRKGRIHASNLGAFIALSVAEPLGIPAYIYDAVAADELCDEARISGLPNIERRSLQHTLNAKAAARKVAQQLGGQYGDMNFVVLHMGGGITTMAHEKGRLIDFVADDQGAFSPERSGYVPHEALIDLFTSGISRAQIMDALKKNAGLKGWLGTNDCQEVQRRIADGDAKAKRVYDTMIYQLAKDIGTMAAALSGRIDAIVLTGGMAYSEIITSGLKARVGFLAPVVVVPGENEMESLTLGALRMLKGEEECHTFA